MITIIWKAIFNCMMEMQDWLAVTEAFQEIADSVEVGYVCPHCGARRGRFEYCQGCGAQ